MHLALLVMTVGYGIESVSEGFPTYFLIVIVSGHCISFLLRVSLSLSLTYVDDMQF